MAGKLYEVLGVEDDATPDEIKRAYRRKSIESHPDRGGSVQEQKRIADAYEVLSNEERRARYDECGDASTTNSLDQVCMTEIMSIANMAFASSDDPVQWICDAIDREREEANSHIARINQTVELISRRLVKFHKENMGCESEAYEMINESIEVNLATAEKDRFGQEATVEKCNRKLAMMNGLKREGARFDLFGSSLVSGFGKSSFFRPGPIYTAGGSDDKNSSGKPIKLEDVMTKDDEPEDFSEFTDALDVDDVSEEYRDNCGEHVEDTDGK